MFKISKCQCGEVKSPRAKVCRGCFGETRRGENNPNSKIKKSKSLSIDEMLSKSFS